MNCFSGFDQPAQVSAELPDIPASRVYGPPDYSPRWARWPFGQSVRLAVGSPWLAKGDHVTVTAWTLAGYVDESLELPGILGSDTRTCPLPSSEGKHFQQALWRDSAKHEATSITVDRGVQLEVLDFGGQGSPIVLLAGPWRHGAQLRRTRADARPEASRGRDHPARQRLLQQA